MCDILPSEILLSQWQRAPLNFSPWGCCLKGEGGVIIVTDNIGNVCPSGLTLQRAMPQKNKLII